MMELIQIDKNKCCCGQYVLDDGEDVIHNDRRHQVFGPEENFCGSVQSHTIKDLTRQLSEAREFQRLSAKSYDANIEGYQADLAEAWAEIKDRHEAEQVALKELAAADDEIARCKEGKNCSVLMSREGVIEALEAMTEGTDRRSPFYESRHKTDCFPDGGAVAITLAAFSSFFFALGFVLGKWVF